LATEKPAQAEFAWCPTQFEYVVEHPSALSPKQLRIQTQPHGVTEAGRLAWQKDDFYPAPFAEFTQHNRLLKVRVRLDATQWISFDVTRTSRAPVGKVSEAHPIVPPKLAHLPPFD
jgi:hypothetical protein